MEAIAVHINQPFYGASSIYGWEKGIFGIGISQKIVDGAILTDQKLQITVGSDLAVYEISPTTIKNQVKKYNSVHKARHGVILYVFPQNKLVKIGGNRYVNSPLDEEAFNGIP